jgi:hypothetical protein
MMETEDRLPLIGAGRRQLTIQRHPDHRAQGLHTAFDVGCALIRDSIFGGRRRAYIRPHPRTEQCRPAGSTPALCKGDEAAIITSMAVRRPDG